jgi:thiol-disulfide isomerase/thioredoxin
MKKILLLLFLPLLGFSQIEVVHFNAEWNSANGVPWVMDLEDCRTIGLTDIAKNPDEATKHKIAVVPTIIIFKDGEEVARFQADLSFKMVATREDVQEEINNQKMSDF